MSLMNNLAWLAYSSPRQHKIPFVYYPLTHLGAGEQPAADKLSSFYTQRHQLALAQASDALVAITPTEASFYAANGINPAQIRVAEPGYISTTSVGDAGRWRYEHKVEQPIVLFLGTMSFDKGTVSLLAAARQLWRAGRAFSLVLAGQTTGEFHALLDNLTPAEKSQLILRRNISEAEKADLLAASTLLVLPSRVESFGIVFQEAWAYGKPVIAAKTWGVQEDVVHHEKDGLLITFGDIEELAEAIARLLDDPTLASQLGQRGQNTLAARYKWPDKIDTIEALYKGLL